MTTLPPWRTTTPLERRWVAEQSGIYNPGDPRTLDAELDGRDGRLPAGEERPAVYEDARAAGGVERVGEPGAVAPKLDKEFPGIGVSLRIAGWGRSGVRVEAAYPVDHIRPRRHRRAFWHRRRQLLCEDEASTLLPHLGPNDVLVASGLLRRIANGVEHHAALAGCHFGPDRLGCGS